jgi:hypothetical protein
MDRVAFLLITAATVCILISPAHAGQLQILSPTPGDHYQIGDSLRVRWVAGESVTQVTIWLSTDNGRFYSPFEIPTEDETIRRDSQYYSGDTGAVQIVIPESLSTDFGQLNLVSQSCLLKVEAPYDTDEQGLPLHAVSDGTFTISAGTSGDTAGSDTSNQTADPTAGSTMSGIAVVRVADFSTYNRGKNYQPGSLVRVTIENDMVTDYDTLGTGHSPSINMSGTYFAYITSDTANTRCLAIQPISGGPEKLIHVQEKPEYVWWTADGSIYYLHGPRRLRRVTLSQVDEKLRVTDRLWARWIYPIQGGFVDMSMTGDRIYFKWEGRPEGCTSEDDPRYGEDGCREGSSSWGIFLTGDTTDYLTRDINRGGCGNGVSPSGRYIVNWGGGHNRNIFTTWVRREENGEWYNTDPDLVRPSHHTLNAEWAILRPGDADGQLERMSPDGWAPWPVGSIGDYNGWSCNSEYWSLSEILIGPRDADNGRNTIAIDWKHRKAINLTKIAPQGDTYKKDGKVIAQYRGVSFSGGQERYGCRGDLWVSTREHIYEPFRTYVDNRAERNRYWARLLGLPEATIDDNVDVNRRQSSTPLVNSFTVRSSGSRVTFCNPFASHSTLAIYRVDGSRLLSQRVSEQSISVDRASMPAGVYLIRFTTPTRQLARSITIR